MSTNVFFNNYNSFSEQNLLEDLIIESIKIYGHDCYYLPRKLNNLDSLYTEDDQSSYETAYPLELYIKSVDGFTGDQEFLSKFGVEIRNQVVFSIAKRRFEQEVQLVNNNSIPIANDQIRPNEGDIIYFPLNKRAFIIRFVQKYEFFYQLGKLYTWEMTCENFEYSNETFNTGILEIDSIQTNLSINVLDWTYYDEDGSLLTDEDGGYLVQENKAPSDLVFGIENDIIQKESDEFVLFDAQNPFSEGSL